ncbi:flagellar hook-length control protein FliK [Litorimonas taeanensis]|uniref:Flagellar hook-length control protein FliK n=2 Tax=Litorimonas taeanensis TaxID=568099 RepID=A0A420WM80_9PROT|nr:flagellar hook-length control protein FliK [Litorimonas taeanensis]
MGPSQNIGTNNNPMRDQDSYDELRSKKEEADFIAALQSEADTQKRLNDTRNEALKNKPSDQIESGFHTIKASHPLSDDTTPADLSLTVGENGVETDLQSSISASLEQEPQFHTIKGHEAPETAASYLDVETLSTVKAETTIDASEQILQSQTIADDIKSSDLLISTHAQNTAASGVVPTLAPLALNASTQGSAKEDTDLEIDISEIEDIEDAAADSVEIDLDLQEQLGSEQDLDAQLFEEKIQNIGFTANSHSGDVLTQSSTSSPLIGLSISGTQTGAGPIASITQPSLSPQSPVANAIVNTVSNTISEAIVTAKETPKGIVVQLDPPEMGRVYIDFLFDQDNAVTVIVKADSADSHAILRERQDFFHQLLSDSGFDSVNLSFEQNTGSGANQDLQDDKAKSYSLQAQQGQKDNSSTPSQPPAYQLGEHRTQIDIRL